MKGKYNYGNTVISLKNKDICAKEWYIHIITLVSHIPGY